jgi:hypothetical protein
MRMRMKNRPKFRPNCGGDKLPAGLRSCEKSCAGEGRKSYSTGLTIGGLLDVLRGDAKHTDGEDVTETEEQAA